MLPATSAGVEGAMLRSMQTGLELIDQAMGRPGFSPAGLPDSVRLEHELAADRRDALDSAAGSFDPLKLYALEVERDQAAEFLSDNIPAAFDLTLFSTSSAERRAGRWQRTLSWCAMANHAADRSNAFSGIGKTPTIAAEKLVNAFRAGQPNVRKGPEAKWLKDADDALGQIDPATTDALLAKLEGRIQTKALRIDEQGRVFVRQAYLPICPDEAESLGREIHDHIAQTSATSSRPLTPAA